MITDKIIKFHKFISMGKADGRIHGLGIPYEVPCKSFEFDKGTLICKDGISTKVFYDIDKIEVINVK